MSIFDQLKIEMKSNFTRYRQVGWVAVLLWTHLREVIDSNLTRGTSYPVWGRFLHSLQENAWITLQLIYDCSLSNPFQFIIHELSFHTQLHNLVTDSLEPKNMPIMEIKLLFCWRWNSETFFSLPDGSVWERDLSWRLSNQTGQVTILTFGTKKRTTPPDNFLSAFVWSIWRHSMQCEDTAQQPIRVNCAAYDTTDSYTSLFR